MLKRFIADDYQSFANILLIALIYIDNNEWFLGRTHMIEIYRLSVRDEPAI